MIKSEKLDKVIELVEESTDLEIMKEMKTVLNKVFGEEFNQIIKPTTDSIIKRFSSASSVLEALEKIVDVREGNDLRKWIESQLSISTCYQIIIYFPEVLITNGRNKHTIKELYTRISVRPNGTMLRDLSGIRAQMTQAEVLSGYAHSHLNAVNPRNIDFTHFCTGEGPINQVMALLSTKFTIPNFMLFCLHLKNFVAWESKEGRPYLYMENIGKLGDDEDTSNPRMVYESVVMDAGNQLVRELKRQNLTPQTISSMLEFKVDKWNIEVLATKKFEIWAGERIRTWDLRSVLGTRSPVSDLLRHIDNSGGYHPVRNNSSTRNPVYDPNRVLFQFKNKNITFKIETDGKEEPKINETVPEQRITKHFCQKLSDLLTNAAFTNVRVKTYRAGSN